MSSAEMLGTSASSRTPVLRILSCHLIWRRHSLVWHMGHDYLRVKECGKDTKLVDLQLGSLAQQDGLPHSLVEFGHDP